MVEREVIVGTLKRQNENLKNLIGEIEEKSRPDRQDNQYFQDALKKIESALKRIRRMNQGEPLGSDSLQLEMKYFTIPLRMRDFS